MPTTKSLLCILLHGGVILDRDAPDESEEKTIYKVPSVTTKGQFGMVGEKVSAEVRIRPKFFERDPVLAEIANCWYHAADPGLFRPGKQGFYEYGVLRHF